MGLLNWIRNRLIRAVSTKTEKEIVPPYPLEELEPIDGKPNFYTYNGFVIEVALFKDEVLGRGMIHVYHLYSHQETLEVSKRASYLGYWLVLGGRDEALWLLATASSEPF